MKHDYTNDEIRDAWKDSVSLCEFLDALPERPQADEIARLKAELNKWEADALRYCKNADFWRSEHDKAQSELAALRQPILADDGRSLIDIYGDAFDVARVKRQLPMKECCDSGFKAVADVVTAQAIRRMEAVPKEEIWKVYKDDPHPFAQEALEAVRARLIAAAKGEWQAQPVVVNEPPKSDGQPDLSGESEKQDEPAQPWTPDNAKAFEDFQAELRQTWDSQPTTSPGWTPAVGDVVRSIPEMALGGQMYWRDLAIQIASVWWKCHNIGASLQHGDLDKNIAFSIVCKRHGGRVFHGDTPENAWHKAEEWLLSPDRENFPAACLTQAQP